MFDATRKDHGGRPEPNQPQSWLPEHKRADLHNGRQRGGHGDVGLDTSTKTTPLATKPGLKLREECVRRKDGKIKPISWWDATEEWREWVAEYQESQAVFTAQGAGESSEKVIPLQNRFSEGRQKEVYAKFHDIARAASSEFVALNTVMLTFTASTKSGAGPWDRCPLNHMSDLLDTWPAVRRELHRTLEGRRWEYARILEPHESGHCHVHVAVFVDGPIKERAFRPVMQAHVDNCLAAGWEAHDPENTNAVHREPAGSIDNLAAYLTAYLMDWGQEPQEAPEHIQRFNALLWASGRRRWSLSQGAQEWARCPEPEPEGEWELTHIEVYGDRFPVKDKGGVNLRKIPGSPGLDPPPQR